MLHVIQLLQDICTACLKTNSQTHAHHFNALCPLQRLQQELPSAILRQVGQCGHIPHVEKPREAAKHLLDFLAIEKTEKADQALSV